MIRGGNASINLGPSATIALSWNASMGYERSNALRDAWQLLRLYNNVIYSIIKGNSNANRAEMSRGFIRFEIKSRKSTSSAINLSTSRAISIAYSVITID
jgi:hypothetical protein